MKYFTYKLIPIFAMLITFYIAFFGSYKGCEIAKFYCILFVLLWYLMFLSRYCIPTAYYRALYIKKCTLLQRLMTLDDTQIVKNNYQVSCSYEVINGDLMGYKMLIDDLSKRVIVHYQDECLISTSVDTLELYNKLKAI